VEGKLTSCVFFEKHFAGLFAKSKQEARKRSKRSMRRLEEIIEKLVHAFKFYLNLPNCASSLYFE
jgi:hypothetical protein